MNTTIGGVIQWVMTDAPVTLQNQLAALIARAEIEMVSKECAGWEILPRAWCGRCDSVGYMYDLPDIGLCVIGVHRGVKIFRRVTDRDGVASSR